RGQPPRFRARSMRLGQRGTARSPCSQRRLRRRRDRAVQTEAGLLRLLQLCSPNLPVGAYAFSQGLEPAVEAGWVSDADSLAAWLRAQLRFSLARVDLPLLLRLRAALEAGDGEARAAAAAA